MNLIKILFIILFKKLFKVTHRPEMLLVQWLETWSIWNILGLLVHDSLPVKTGSNRFSQPVRSFRTDWNRFETVSNQFKPK